MKDRKSAVILNFLFLVSTLVVNYLSVNLPLNGLTPGEISDQFNVYFVPAGYVFSIWGVIYIGLITYTVFQALPQNRQNESMAKADPWFMVSNVANALWLICYHYEQFALSLVMMTILLVSLVKIYEIFEIGKHKATRTWKWAVEVPFGLYLGWITIATIANVTQVLDFYNWNGFGISDEVWFIIVVCCRGCDFGLDEFQTQSICIYAGIHMGLCGNRS